MSLKTDQIERILQMVERKGAQGVRETQILYLEARHHGFGTPFTRMTLNEMVGTGLIYRRDIGPKRFKTVSDREKNRVVKYYYGRDDQASTGS